ncbi:hypothetical protein ILYODFUR_015008 [Ilyodon furcidens]|uniref:Uncharacterized protein n=1 Tax=Ilyodon furcidens TaxID=33524 RepID=A0ABV0TYG3_9TELE
MLFSIFLRGQKTDDTTSQAVMPWCIPELALGTYPLTQLGDKGDLTIPTPLEESPRKAPRSKLSPTSCSSLAKCTSTTPVSSITVWMTTCSKTLTPVLQIRVTHICSGSDLSTHIVSITCRLS